MHEEFANLKVYASGGQASVIESWLSHVGDTDSHATTRAADVNENGYSHAGPPA